MALLPLGPAAPAAPPPPVGIAAVKAEAGMTIENFRQMLTLGREAISLWREAQPMLEMIRPKPPEVVIEEPIARPAARAPAPEVAESRESAPPMSEVAAAKREEEAAAVAKARAELAALVNTKLSKPQILQLASAFGPFALAEKMPKLADALGAHAAEADVFLNAFSEQEIKDILCELLPLVPAKDVPMARVGLLQAVQAFEKEAAAPSAPPAGDEPKKDGGAA